MALDNSSCRCTKWEPWDIAGPAILALLIVVLGMTVAFMLGAKVSRLAAGTEPPAVEARP